MRSRRKWGSEGGGRHGKGPQVRRRRLGAREKRGRGGGRVKDVNGGGSKDSTTMRPEERRDADERVRQVRVGKKITGDR